MRAPISAVAVGLALLAVPAVAAAENEATVAAPMPDPKAQLASVKMRGATVRACATVRWAPQAGEGSVRFTAFADDAPTASATRTMRVDDDGDRDHTCVALDAPDIDRPARDHVLVEAEQIVDGDRDGFADRLGFDAAGAESLAAKAPCDMKKLSAVTALTTCRNWIVFPSPSLNDNSPASAIETQLRFLYQQGFRGIVTYTIAGTMNQVPRIAKQIGFQKVLAGLWDPAAEIGRVAAIQDQIDGVVVGNEGVQRRYSIDQLEAWVRQLKSSYPDLVGFTKTNVDLYFRSSKLPVILKEAWWPSNVSAGPGCTLQPNAPPGNGWTSAPYSEAAQQRFYSGLVGTGIKFVWAEPFDLNKPECKNPPPAGYGGLIGPYWGLWRSPGAPKPVVSVIDVGRY